MRGGGAVIPCRREGAGWVEEVRRAPAPSREGGRVSHTHCKSRADFCLTAPRPPRPHPRTLRTLRGAGAAGAARSAAGWLRGRAGWHQASIQCWPIVSGGPRSPPGPHRAPLPTGLAGCLVCPAGQHRGGGGGERGGGGGRGARQAARRAAGAAAAAVQSRRGECEGRTEYGVARSRPRSRTRTPHRPMLSTVIPGARKHCQVIK